MTISLRHLVMLVIGTGITTVVVTLVVGAFSVHWALGAFTLGMVMTGIGTLLADIGGDLGWFD